MADQVAHPLRVDRRPPQPFERMVQRCGEIGRRVGERAVEVEGDDVEGEGGHEANALDRIPAKRNWVLCAGSLTTRGSPAYGNGKVSVASDGFTSGHHDQTDTLRRHHPRRGQGHADEIGRAQGAAPDRRPRRCSTICIGVLEGSARRARSSSSAAAASRSRPLVEARGGEVVVQEPQLGTAHAVRQAEAALAGFDGDVLILYGDTPLIEAETMARMLDRLHGDDRARRGGASASGRTIRASMAGSSPVPTARSRRWSNTRMRREAERAVDLCNSGLMAARADDLFAAARPGRQRQCGGRILSARRRHARRRATAAIRR